MRHSNNAEIAVFLDMRCDVIVLYWLNSYKYKSVTYLINFMGRSMMRSKLVKLF